MALRQKCYILTWHISIGYSLVELAIHNYMHFQLPNLNRNIKAKLNQLDESTRNQLAYTLVNLMDFQCSEPGYYHVSNPSKIEKCLNNYGLCFLSKIWDISDRACIRYSNLSKIITQDSPLLGEPFPEKTFVRIRLDLNSFIIMGPGDPTYD